MNCSQCKQDVKPQCLNPECKFGESNLMLLPSILTPKVKGIAEQLLDKLLHHCRDILVTEKSPEYHDAKTQRVAAIGIIYEAFKSIKR